MTTLYLGTDGGPVVVTGEGDLWHAADPVDVGPVSCIAADPLRPERLLCGTWGRGVWLSDNGGADFRPAFEGIPHRWITALAVTPGDPEVVYAGTEPSAVFRSMDFGRSWAPCAALTDLPSSGSWSFPPRPHTHHVRWIEPDRHALGGLFVAIEAGALVSSPDGGETWQDRVPGGPYDTHELASHAKEAGRLWSAAGDGFFESADAGGTWARAEEGLAFRYCWSVAVDVEGSGTILVSASPGPMQAHTSERARSALYRRVGEESWHETDTRSGQGRAVRARVLAAGPAEPGVFYAAGDDGIHQSLDAGATWRHLPADPPLAPGTRVHALRLAT